MRILATGFVLFGVLVSFPASALEASGVGVLNFSFPQVSNLGSAESGQGVSLGGGMLIAQQVYSAFEIEGGVLLLPRKWSLGDNQITENRMTFPLVARYRVPEGYIYGGTYYSLGYGKLGRNGSEIDYSDMNQSRSDFGLLVGLGKSIPIEENLNFLTRGQLMVSLSDASKTPLTTIHYWDIQVLIGLSFSFK